MWSWALTRPGTATQLGAPITSSAGGASPEPTSAMRPSRVSTQPLSISRSPVYTRPARISSVCVTRLRIDEVVRAHRHAGDRAAAGRSDGGHDRRARRDGWRLADTFQAVGRVGVAKLQDIHAHGRHVERGRKKVVGERGVADDAVLDLDLLHHRQTEP